MQFVRAVSSTLSGNKVEAMRKALFVWVAAIGLSAWQVQDVSAQEQKKPPKASVAPAEKLADGWEEIDQRLIFLMVRLANTEASLEAVEQAIAGGSRKQMKREGEATTADKKNEELDRKGGGPVQWYKFYGKTAEKFYFRPTGQAPTPVGRPPQFDYIYRANETAKARAEQEIKKLRGKTDVLLERRQRLEAEQAELWCEIAFRAVAHHDLHKRPLYRFEPLKTVDDSDAKEHAEVVKAVAFFMRLALSIIDLAQEDQAATFSKIKPAVANARQALDDAWLREGVDASDKKTTEGKFAALAKRLDEMASNLSDSYVVAVEGEEDQDQQRKDTFRGLLQESLVDYAAIILTLDETAVAMRDQWHIKPDLDQPIAAFTLASLESAVPGKSSAATEPETGPMPASANRPTSGGRRGLTGAKPPSAGDLLSRIDLATHARSGNIKAVGKSVIVDSQSVLSIPPFSSTGNYQIEISFVRTSGSDALVVALPIGEGHFNLGLSSEFGRQHNLMSAAHQPGNLENGKHYTLRLRVKQKGRNGDVEMLLNGESIMRTQFAIAPADRDWAGIQPAWIPALKSQNATYEIQSITLKRL
jgi:hypothetical protein